MTIIWLWLTTCCNAITDTFTETTIELWDPYWDLGGLNRLGMPFCTKCGEEIWFGGSTAVREVRSDLAEALWSDTPTYEQSMLLWHEWEEDGHYCEQCGDSLKCGMRDGLGEEPWICYGDRNPCPRCQFMEARSIRITE